jgi:anthraniloyl-CoA monooxygenase
MKVTCVGGGPGGLYFALLLKQLDPRHTITVIERNRPDDTFGWGVVFSKETLDGLAEADAPSYAEITRSFAYWDDIHTHFGGTCTRSIGHGFCGLSRRRLLNILHERCRDLGVRLVFEREVDDLAEMADADLIVAADGVNSRIREQNAAHFQPEIEWGRCRFSWLGTTRPLEAFTFLFHPSEHGLFQVHAYPFEPGLGTFIVECREEVWRAAGLDGASEQHTVDFCEALFADFLDGHRLLVNRSIWRSFPTVTNARWWHDRIVLVGDAAHTAHFSIGSGTKLAMEDAIALVDAFRRHGDDDLAAVLAAYEEARRIEVLKLQRAARTSREWFENAARYLPQPPLQFTFNLLTRSKRITYENLEQRDPELVARVRAWYAGHVGMPAAADGTIPAPAFAPYRLRDLRLANRIVVSPMCQYSAEDGTPNDWHLVHLGSRAVGGAGLVFSEMTDVSREGRISPGCTGMYQPEHVVAWRRIVEFVHRYTGAKIALQLAHAGRKASTRLQWEGDVEPLAEGNWPILSASPIPYFPHSQVPREATRADLDEIREDFVRAALMAEEAGFDLLELHMAHGYLLSSFISPLTNHRTDELGGPLESRMRYPLEVFDAVRAVWPAQKPMSVRISATDWVEDGGLTGDDAVAVARLLAAHGCDLIDVSAGQTTPDAEPLYGRMFQVPFSDQIRHEAGVPTMAVGNIQGIDHCNTVLAAGRADLCAMARPHLKNPYLTLHAAEATEYYDQPWPNQYLTVRPRRRD